MSLTEINADDLNKLRYFRIERLRGLFISSLQRCLIRTDSANTLIIHCPDPGIVDELLNELEDLRNHAWMLLGVKSIALYFYQEEILRTRTSSRTYQSNAAHYTTHQTTRNQS
jgi:hypothetical protein